MSNNFDPNLSVRDNWRMAVARSANGAPSAEAVEELVSATAKDGVTTSEWNDANRIKAELYDQLLAARSDGGAQRIEANRTLYNAAEDLVRGLRRSPGSGGLQLRRAATKAVDSIPKPRLAVPSDPIARVR